MSLSVALLGSAGTIATPASAAERPHTGTATGASAASSRVRLSAGAGHTCAITNSGAARCWGVNSYGQLGNGTTINSSIPVTVSGLTDAVAISTGAGHACALRATGTVRCWGRNTDGQLGNGTTVGSPVPVPVSSLSDVSAIAVGDRHSCAVLIGGSVKCWGWNSRGQLGNGTTTQSTVPVTVSGATGVVSVSSGEQHSCSTLTGGAIKCWGANNRGQLGNATFIDSSTPVVASDLNGATSVAAGDQHTCATLSNGTARCWGTNTAGQLGDGGAAWGSSSTPRSVIGLTNAVAVSAGGASTCALLVFGTAKCWGLNESGELGNGASGPDGCPSLLFDGCALSPQTVTALANAVAITVGDYPGPICALLASATAKCWGPNGSGELGTGNTTTSMTPALVVSLGIGTGMSALATGQRHTCAVTANGSARCWGGNTFGQVGDGTNTNRTTPVSVGGL
ncbi:MAG: RCC1 repeat-containing protein, partial [Actinomycetota bacterium]